MQIAKETGWGYSRILGELRKLNLGKISRQSVKNILVEHGIDPGPNRGRGSWSEFLQIHADTLWQVDFFSKMVVTPKGLRQVFAMAFLQVDTRRVFVTPATLKPRRRLDEGPGSGVFETRGRAGPQVPDDHARLGREVHQRLHVGLHRPKHHGEASRPRGRRT